MDPAPDGQQFEHTRACMGHNSKRYIRLPKNSFCPKVVRWWQWLRPQTNAAPFLRLSVVQLRSISREWCQFVSRTTALCISGQFPQFLYGFLRWRLPFFLVSQPFAAFPHNCTQAAQPGDRHLPCFAAFAVLHQGCPSSGLLFGAPLFLNGFLKECLPSSLFRAGHKGSTPHRN